jgi:hypothetical protein
MGSFLPETASAMYQVQIGTLLKFAEAVPLAAAALVIAVLAAVVGLVRCDVDAHEPLPPFTGASGASARATSTPPSSSQ